LPTSALGVRTVSARFRRAARTGYDPGTALWPDRSQAANVAFASALGARPSFGTLLINENESVVNRRFGDERDRRYGMIGSCRSSLYAGLERTVRW
jgi:hypothetical protein